MREGRGQLATIESLFLYFYLVNHERGKRPTCDHTTVSCHRVCRWGRKNFSLHVPRHLLFLLVFESIHVGHAVRLPYFIRLLFYVPCGRVKCLRDHVLLTSCFVLFTICPRHCFLLKPLRSCAFVSLRVIMKLWRCSGLYT